MADMALERSSLQTRRHPALAWPRRILDVIYLWSAYLAAASMVIILVLTLAQMVGRYIDVNPRGLSDYAGYFMAASAFLAFAHALNRGSHVRITLLLQVAGRYRFILELVSMALSTLIAGWFAFYACKMVYWSYKLNDISTGLDATPLWIPQLSMAAGAVLFAIALADQLARLVFRGAHTIPSEEAGD